jgi:hypothetical protein
MTDKRKQEVSEQLGSMLAPCLIEEPVAGAVVLVSSDAGLEFVALNMQPLEVLVTLEHALVSLRARYCVPEASTGVLQ